MQREMEAWLGRAEEQSGPPDRADDDLEGWLRSDDSPLLLHNVEEFVHDPEAHLRAIAERVEGPGRAAHYSGTELAGGPPRGNSRDQAEELRARLRTVAELDAERILAVPRRRGTPRGKTRTHYLWLVSPDRNISNADFKRLVLNILRRRWPGAVVAGYIHRDTDNTHFHLWLSAETLSGKKISVTRMRPSGDAILDKYPDLDEEVARSVSRHFGDPSIYDDHIARKLEWVHWRERFEEALRRGERPPVMPHRARHDYDWVGERRAVADRERGESRPYSGEREKAAPAPRTKSLMGALELWGKTVHLEARVGYRRELLASLDGWGPLLVDHPVEGLRGHFTRELARAEREYERHRIAFEKTLENRALLDYGELRHPLHNSRQIAEMKQMAELTHDAELLRHVHSYLILDRPGPAETTLSQAIGERWGEQIGARLGVYERARLLQDVAEANRQLREESRAGDIPPGARMRGLDPDQEIVRGWLGGGWTRRQMEDSAGLIADAGTSYHAGRYLKACDYLAAANEVLGQYRRGAEAMTAYPVLDQAQRHRLDALARDGASGLGNAGTLWLKEVAAVMDLREPPGRAKFLRLMERSLEINQGHEPPSQRDGGQPPDLGTLRPHDERWMSRLVSVTELKEAEALAVAMRGATGEDFRNCEARAREMRARLELATVIRAAGGEGDLPQGRDLTRVEGRELDNHRSY
ncbi:MAG: hypothetical protein H0T60_11830, partial [Acidobacteria bacterium]|nr:hypothetical protein [Acidobacteriota bacterium]